jgi:hypothetical protein
MSPLLPRWSAVVALALLLAPAVFADDPPVADAVAALRAALRRPAADELERTAILTPVADLLHSPGDLGRALLLDEWRDEDRKYPLRYADKQVRDKLLARFEEQVRQALADPDPAVRQAAATALGRFGKPDAAAREALRKALNDPDATVRGAAAEALLAGK